MEVAKILTSFSIQKVAHPRGINLQLAAETCEYLQVPSLSMGIHGTLRYLNLTFINWNGHMLKTISPLIPKGEFCGFRGSKMQKSGKSTNGWTDWHQIWYTSADSSGMDIG